MVIEIPLFPTHIARSDNKFAPNKMQKINNQAIYNGSLNRFARAIVMNNLHDYLAVHMHTYLPAFLRSGVQFPVCVELEVHTVINHGDISMRKGKTCWKPAKPGYEPGWDIENLASIWIKALNDVFTRSKFIPDDNVKYIDCVGYKFEQVKTLEDRKLVIKIDET